jgi:hypothetical protein
MPSAGAQLFSRTQIPFHYGGCDPLTTAPNEPQGRVRHEEHDAVRGRHDDGGTSRSPGIRNAFDVWIAEVGARLCPAAWLEGPKARRRPHRMSGLPCFPAIGRRRESETSGRRRGTPLGLSAARWTARRPIVQKIRALPRVCCSDERVPCRAVSWAVRSHQLRR